MCSMLRNLLLLAQTLIKMFSPSTKNRLHPGFAKAFDLLEVDKCNILGLPGSRYKGFKFYNSYAAVT